MYKSISMRKKNNIPDAQATKKQTKKKQRNNIPWDRFNANIDQTGQSLYKNEMTQPDSPALRPGFPNSAVATNLVPQDLRSCNFPFER
uniref:Uncharacterized protein n=1 Tax=Anguilla anguilla TaxID=7936 RepID=A0A0E9W8T6_ANGAN